VGRPILYDELRARVRSPCDHPVAPRARIRSCRVAHCSHRPQVKGAGDATRHRNGHPPHEVALWEALRLRPGGRIDMTLSGLEGFGHSLSKEDEVVVEATGNAMAVVRVIVANPLQVKAIAHAHVKTDKIDAGVMASLRAAGFLPEVWLPDADTECRRRLIPRRNQVVRHQTRIKNEVHSILQTHLIPPCPHADLFGRLDRSWLGRQQLPVDDWAGIERHLRELDRLGEVSRFSTARSPSGY
jgi:transposase